MAIAIFPSLEGESLEDFSIKLAERWRLGQKGLDNGVILVVFVKDRKLRFEVGYGLEPAITDAVASGIIRDLIAPRFREGRYAAGLEAAASAIYGRIAGEGGGAAPRRRAPDTSTLALLLLFAVIAGFVVVSQLGSARRLARRSGYTAGSGGWYTPTNVYRRGGWGWGGGGGGGGFSGGGGGFGGGGASGEW